MAALEVMHHRLELMADLSIAEREHRIDQALGPRGMAPVALPGKVEWTNDDAGRVRLKPERMEL
jgi:hypothetical protein